MSSSSSNNKKRGPAYINPFRCSICQSHIGNMVTHTLEDAKEIYDLLLKKKTGMMCISCSSKYSKKEGYDDDTTKGLK